MESLQDVFEINKAKLLDGKYRFKRCALYAKTIKILKISITRLHNAKLCKLGKEATNEL